MSGPKYVRIYGDIINYQYQGGGWVYRNTTRNYAYYLSASYQKGKPLRTDRGIYYIVPNPYAMNTEKCGQAEEITYGRCDGVPIGRTVMNGTYVPSLTRDGRLDWSSLVTEAIARLDSKGADQNSEMLTKDLYDASNLVIEYGQRLLASLRYLKKGKFAKAYKAFNKRQGRLRNSRQAIADHWLAFQWGVKPSMDAIVNAFNLATSSEERSTFVVRTSVHRRTKLHVWTQDFPSPSVKTEVGDQVMACYLTRQFVDVSYKSFAAAWNNPIVPAWDAVPYSFLIDWFIPIGDYLKQFGYYQSVNPPVVRGSNAQVLEKYVDGSYTSSSQYYRVTMSVSSPYRRYTLDRVLDNRIHAIYTLADIIDRSEFGLTKSRATNLIALCASKF